MTDLLTTAQAAERLGIQSAMVRRYCRQGRLPAQKVGRDWLIDTADLGQFKPRRVGRPKRTQPHEGGKAE